MKIKFKKHAMTLAEIAVMFAIIAVIILATLGISKSKTDKIKSYQYYAAFTNLKHAVGEVFADGYLNTSTGLLEKTLPPDGHNGTDTGLCDKFIKIFNTVGTNDCTLTTTTNFDDAHVNFTLTNGTRFFNAGSNAVSNIFTYYIDINGKKGNGVLDDDVMEFKIYRNGMVLPATTSIGGMNPRYLSASVKEVTANTWVAKGIPYLEAICMAGEMSSAYCAPLGYSLNASCSSPNSCQTYINKP